MGNSLLNELRGLEFYSFDPTCEPEQVISNFLFCHPGHLSLQSKSGWQIFSLKVKGKAVVQIAFNIKNKNARSPLKAPFGSIRLAGNINQKQMFFFLQRVVMVLRESGVETILIQNFPQAYNPAATQLLRKSLASLGFAVRAQVSSVLEVDRNNFESKIRISERQKLNKGNARFLFKRVATSHLARVYKFIETCRKNKGKSLSMPLQQLRGTIKAFPDDFFLFEVTENEQVVAAAVVIQVNKQILYTFYYAHDQAFDKISPIVFLFSGLYSFAQFNNYEMIDLGTSMTGNEINISLLHFKESLGARPTPKYIFEKTF
jgi:hypothetical protein